MWEILWPYIVVVGGVWWLLSWALEIDEPTKRMLRKPVVDLVMVAADFIHDNHLEEFREYYKSRVILKIQKQPFYSGDRSDV